MKDIKHIRREFHSVAWVMSQGSDLGGPWGVEWSKKIFFPKFNQIWCVSNLHQWHMQGHNFWDPHPLGPWGGAKRSNIIKFRSQSISKIFKPNFVCLLTIERYKTYQRGFSFRRLGHAPGVGLGGTVGGWGSKNFFSQIQPDFVCELLTWMAHAMAHIFGSPPPGAFGRDQKVKYH